MIWKSKFPDVVVPNVSFSEYMFREIAVHDPNRVCLVNAMTGQGKTFGEFEKEAKYFASAMTKRGIKKGDVVGLCSLNCPEYIISILGLAACGATITACNPFSTPDELNHQFSHSCPVAILTSAFTAENVKLAVEGVNSVKNIYSYTPVDGFESYPSLLKNEDGAALPSYLNINPKEDILFLPYSSGTTGLPKGVMLTHYSFIALLTICRVSAKAIVTDTAYSILPLFHIYGLMAAMIHVAIGSKHILDVRFDIERTFSMIQKEKVTMMSGVPPMILAMVKSPLLTKYDLSSLKVMGSGAAPLAKDLADQMLEKAGIQVFNGWGLTEMVPIVLGDLQRVPPNSVGFVAPNTMLKVVDVDNNRELGPNEDGELCAKGPQLMKGYYKNIKATQECIDPDGYFHTGDIGHVDESGRIFIVDRLKELIKYKGFQVAPAELEGLLISHGGIADAAVIGIPNEEAGEIPRAFVVLRDTSLTPDKIHKFVEGHVSKYKYLRGGIEIVSEIPKSPSGKILRRFLRKEYAERTKSKL